MTRLARKLTPGEIKMASLLFGERLSALGYGGLAVGITGLCLLEVPPQALQSLLSEGPAGAP